MTSNQECLDMQYFYNAVIEFIYFIILYIEGLGKINLNTLCKHVKFFKIEVGTFILSFHGQTFEEKLYHMLNILGCFKLSGKKIYIKKNKSFKDAIFKDLVISKCIDLVLKGINNIDDIRENLNFNNVIHVNKKNILDIIEKSSYFSIKNKQKVILNHFHGSLGFEDNVSNSVICYFFGVLYLNKVISFSEMREHSKFSSLCGIHNFIITFSILSCSQQFYCENGLVWLKKKSKKYPKLKPIDLELQGAKFSSKSVSVGEIVLNAYGPSLFKWTGEICSLNESSGIICCVVDFKNGYHGVFNVSFNETALKVISEIHNLKKYLNIRDVVEFDAYHYFGKTSEICWTASRLTILDNKKFVYDKNLYDELYYKTKILKNECANNRCCLNSFELTFDNICNNYQNIKSQKFGEEKMALEIVKISDSDFFSITNSDNKLQIICENDIKKDISDKKSLCNLQLSFSNLFILDYLFMFGYVSMLMADKGIAIAEKAGKFYNILFMKDSVYSSEKFKNLVNGQKVLVLIPYHGTLESFCVSTLVYGLNEKEACEIEKDNILPKDFAGKVFGDTVAEKLQCKSCNISDGLNGLKSEKEDFTTVLKQRIEFIELYEFLLREYKVPFQNDYLLQFLFCLYKVNYKENFNEKVFHFLVKLSKYLKRNIVHKARRKCERKHEVSKSSVNNQIPQIEVQVHDLHCSISSLSLTDENSLSVESSLYPSSKYLDVQSTKGSLSSYKTCSSSDSIDSFHSCESIFNSPSTSPIPLPDEEDPIVPQDLQNKTEINFESNKSNQIQSQPYSQVSCLLSESDQDFTVKSQGKNLKQRLHLINPSKYLSLKSVSTLKHSAKKKKTIAFPRISKSVCKNCFKSSVSLAACISMISKSFFFFTLNINGCNVILPLLKRAVPPDLQGNMKLHSSSKITVIPNALTNLSHIIVIDLFT